MKEESETDSEFCCFGWQRGEQAFQGSQTPAAVPLAASGSTCMHSHIYLLWSCIVCMIMTAAPFDTLSKKLMTPNTNAPLDWSLVSCCGLSWGETQLLLFTTRITIRRAFVVVELLMQIFCRASWRTSYCVCISTWMYHDVQWGNWCEKIEERKKKFVNYMSSHNEPVSSESPVSLLMLLFCLKCVSRQMCVHARSIRGT
jgi:hypothetical protein